MRNILSLDWDYFIDADIATRTYAFPDGKDDLAPFLQNFIWAGLYAKNPMENVGVKTHELEYIKGLLAKLPKTTKVVIAESHFLIYKYIMDSKISNLINIYNVDFHHDLFDNSNFKSGKVDCGCWFRTLVHHGIVFNGLWVKQKDSQTIKDMKDLDVKSTTKIEKLGKIDFDFVFICKSSPWSPPHLDSHFIELVDSIKAMGFSDVVIDDRGMDVMKDRFKDAEFQARIEEQKAVIQQFLGKEGVLDNLNRMLESGEIALTKK